MIKVDIFRKIIVIISILGVLFPCEGDTNLDGSIDVLNIVRIIDIIVNTQKLILVK